MIKFTTVVTTEKINEHFNKNDSKKITSFNSGKIDIKDLQNSTFTTDFQYIDEEEFNKNGKYTVTIQTTKTITFEK